MEGISDKVVFTIVNYDYIITTIVFLCICTLIILLAHYLSNDS